MKLSKNLSNEEIACRCGCGFGETFGELSPQLVTGFQVLREVLGTPLHINSGCRCYSHNKAIGGAAKSQHLRGHALDLSSSEATPEEIAKAAESIPILYNGGIGRYDTFTHIDIGRKRRWDNRL